MKAFFERIWKWIALQFWKKPVAEPAPPKATEVIGQYTCIKYNNTWIALRKTELAAWNSLSRKRKREMAQTFRQREKKGEIKFVEINGRMACVKNRNYEQDKYKITG